MLSPDKWGRLREPREAPAGREGGDSSSHAGSNMCGIKVLKLL
jgi:hypothetical protein